MTTPKLQRLPQHDEHPAQRRLTGGAARAAVSGGIPLAGGGLSLRVREPLECLTAAQLAIGRAYGEGDTWRQCRRKEGSTFYLGEGTFEPGFSGPPPHVHERLHDMFYVLEGTLTMRLGDDTVELAAGSFVCVPPGVVHTFSNPGMRQVRVLNFNTPAGWENYMRDLGAALAEGAPSPEEIGRIASRYDFQVA